MPHDENSVSLAERVIQAFKKVNKEISIDTLEHDFSPRFAKYFVENVLGYSGSEYKFVFFLPFVVSFTYLLNVAYFVSYAINTIK